MTPVTKLSALTRCPVCGEAWTGKLSNSNADVYTVGFGCGASFRAERDAIHINKPCPAPSRIQEDALNREENVA